MRRKQRDGRKIIKSILFWVPFVGFITIIAPSTVISFVGFYALLSLALFFTLKHFLALGRTLLWVTAIIVYLLLRQFHISNLVNILLLLGIFVTFEVYFRKS